MILFMERSPEYKVLVFFSSHFYPEIFTHITNWPIFIITRIYFGGFYLYMIKQNVVYDQLF